MSNSFFKSSIGRKYAMAASAFFLMFFLLQHLTINLLSVCSPATFNEVSHFMGHNPVVQFALQPVLIFAVLFHFIMGFILEAKNRGARTVKYAKYAGNENSTWFSRNMLVSGLVILAFLGLHFYDFWIHEMTVKYFAPNQEMINDATRYYPELREKFVDPIRVGLYVVSFVLLAMHLLHGFNSAFQSVGGDTKFKTGRQKFGVAFAILVPLGYVFIAVFHFLTK